ncbi:DUF423 domain-containing protein [Pseudoalteromonas denitrificans]|uniref:Uncharacterized membrane protein YgdD, TMEM256/DUF423 family n=1 Tax=Pseudoalteromonas denitrificans DSM 6059 TaxID=1123010 RepID=A0A1I1F152_9GAMM|nr:DUF423 domain-containing protein [Pseudoalteromonas denitrificans]SFB92642.1 Uncharacterized membrane protein YgdD, TMEM256/DUF423 family [Pseudoalteromonas denitrificans DSM 6059]
MTKIFLILGGVFAVLSVLLGAFAAHGLKSKLTEQAIATFQVGVTYQMYHALALVLFALVAKQGVPLNWASGFLVTGIVFFSGSLYALAFTGFKWFGPITPLGGVCFIIAWVLFIFQVYRYFEV